MYRPEYLQHRSLSGDRKQQPFGAGRFHPDYYARTRKTFVSRRLAFRQPHRSSFRIVGKVRRVARSVARRAREIAGKEESRLPYQRRSRGAIASTREAASKGPGAGPNSNLSAILKKAHQRGLAKSQRVSGTGHGYLALANMESGRQNPPPPPSQTLDKASQSGAARLLRPVQTRAATGASSIHSRRPIHKSAARREV